MSDTVLDPKERKKRYKKSLNLPKTSFPMRANLAQNEPQSQKRWRKEGLLQQVLDARRGDEPFIFHDGPPFANGEIHVGHLLNKVLKDLVVRTRLLDGRYCHYIPGWDCHGLPIEHKVVADLVESGKMDKLDTLDADTRRLAIRRACHAWAEKYKKLQAEQMQRLLTLADYDHPYLTMRPDYEESVLEVFRALFEQGLVYRDLKPVHWSIANRTALAEAELEYFDREDPSIYVDFEADDATAVAAAFGVDPASFGDARPALMIWTTTPWTLPANRLIVVHEDFDYALVRLGERLTVVAEELVARVARAAGVADDALEVLATAKGSALVGLAYRHPFIDDAYAESGGQVVAGEHATLEDGTGLVHTAPGHGEEDYLVGLREQLPIYSPVRGDGTYDDTVPEWLRGLSVWDANPKIIERLRADGFLVHHVDFLHRYPHDWRSKTPVIFRCTEQWFIAVDRPTKRDGKSLRELALGAAEASIDFVPGWGRNRLRGMLESRPDWCISRQRAWGLPIPAFRTASGEVLLTAATLRAVGEVFGREGSDAWFQHSPAELLASWDPDSDPDAPSGVDLERLEKMYDIFDVWLESGSSWHAVVRQRGLGYPCDLYLEGSDQHRGWFQLSLLPALGATGQAPFRALLTHGFTVDKDGKKFSKSSGDALLVQDLLKDYGADVMRWWVSSLVFEHEIKVDLSFFDAAGESYRKVRNTLRFMLSNVDTPYTAEETATPAPTSLDAWILARAAELRRRVVESFRAYDFRQAHTLLFDFCNEDLSAVYLDAIKDRLYCDLPDSPRRRSAQATLGRLTDLLAHLLAPILPHTADEVHQALRGDEAASIHVSTYPEIDAPPLDDAWSVAFATRERALKAVEDAKATIGFENPADVGLEIADPDGVLARVEAELVDLFGVSRVHLTAGDAEAAPTIIDLREEPRCERSWRRDTTVALRRDGGLLSDRDYEAVQAAAT